MAQIKESEDFYNGKQKPSLVRENNDTFPFMSGFVDHLYSELDEPPTIEFCQTDEADYKMAKKTTAFFENEKASTLPHAKWALKDRYSKKLAIFSGRAILKYFAESDPVYRSNLQIVDHYDFHNEPGGGGHLEDHLFCGQEAIFKTKEDLLSGAKDNFYDFTQVNKLMSLGVTSDHKTNEDDYNNRLNRHQGLQLDPQSNNYVGQELWKFCEWYLTYAGCRYYILFDERTGEWIRCKLLRDIFSVIESTGDALWPYVSWATHEDPKVFWSKAPCDDALPIAKRVDKLINQEIYNREKKNKGSRLYDPLMITDVEALADPRPDGLIPVDTKNGKRALSTAIYKVESGEITGTIDLVQWLDSYYGTKTGSTPGAMGNAEKDKKVGVYLGEMQQVQRRLGIYNLSYKEAWAEIGLRFLLGLDDQMTTDQAVKLIGPDGIEWTTLTRADLKRNRPYDIKVVGGDDYQKKNEAESQKKLAGLEITTTVNPRWKDREILKAAGYTDDQLKDAFSSVQGDSAELMSEAAQAIEDIQNGLKPKINRGANTAFIQKILDYSYDLNVEDNKKELELAHKLADYALEHIDIAAQNEARNVAELVKAAAGAPTGAGAAGGDMAGAVINSSINAKANPSTITPPTATPTYQGQPGSVPTITG